MLDNTLVQEQITNLVTTLGTEGFRADEVIDSLKKLAKDYESSYSDYKTMENSYSEVSKKNEYLLEQNTSLFNKVKVQNTEEKVNTQSQNSDDSSSPKSDSLNIDIVTEKLLEI